MTSNARWVWVGASVVHAIHEEQLAEHGGPAGLRDGTLLESALARPLQLAAYKAPDVQALAAAYGLGLSKNHPFVDGNKRTAFVTVELFLAMNGWALTASDAECVLAMLQLAAGECSEDQFAQWIRTNSEKS